MHSTNERTGASNHRCGKRNACGAAGVAALCALVLAAGCTATRFPLIKPVERHSREWYSQRRAQEYFIRARECERHGLSQMALRYYEMAYELEPESKTLRQILVQRYIFSSKFNQALLCIRGAKREINLSDSDKALCAGIYMRMGQYSRAAELLESVANKHKEEYYMLGLLYESLGNIPKALANYKGFLKEDPSSIDMTLKVGSLYARLKEYGAAESLFVAAGKNNGQNPQLFNAIGEVKRAKGDSALALDFFKMAVMIDSNYLEGVRNIAQAYIHKNDYAAAIPYYERLYASDSTGELFGKTLALLYYYANRYERAKSLIRTMLASDIEDYELHFYLGLAYEGQDSLDISRVEFEKTLAIRNDFADAWLQISFLDLKRKEMDEALADAQLFTKSMPSAGASWRTLGYVYNVRKEFQRALSPLRKAIGLDSLDSFAWYELGSALERTKDAASSTAAFRRVLALKPDDAAAANYLGYMWADAGVHLDSAKTLLEFALAHDSANGAFLDSYAWVLYKMGKTDSALVYIRKALGHISDDGVVLSHFGDILLKMGREREALDAYKKSLEVDATSDESDHVHDRLRALESKPGNGEGKKSGK
jgi:tetratricopeptide (TPR) repeat protein